MGDSFDCTAVADKDLFDWSDSWSLYCKSTAINKHYYTHLQTLFFNTRQILYIR